MGDKITGIAIALVGYAIVALFGLITLGFLIAALYLAFAGVLEPASAAAVTGGVLLLLALMLLLIVRSMGKRSVRRTEVSSTQTAEELGATLRTALTAWLSNRARYTIPTALASGFIAGFSPKARRSLVRVLRDVLSAVQRA